MIDRFQVIVLHVSVCELMVLPFKSHFLISFHLCRTVNPMAHENNTETTVNVLTFVMYS